jgi:hypothetical protein
VLRRRDLVDEFVLLIHALVLGSGLATVPAGATPATRSLWTA